VTPKVEQITAGLPGLRHVVRFGYLDGTGWPPDFLGPPDAELAFEPVPFDHPLWVLYSVRMGTAEIYRAVLSVPEVIDALVVDLPRDDGVPAWMPLFVVLSDGITLSDELIATIRHRVREDCSPRHVPDEVRSVAAVPRTLSGKVLEVPVKRVLLGAPADSVASRESLADPSALEFFVALADEYREPLTGESDVRGG
jgi:AMP-binding enzyme C-terminal domain